MSQSQAQPIQHNALAQLHAETWSEDRAFRRSLGKMMLRVLEKLEAEFTLGRTRHSTSSSLARELRATCEYLEGLHPIERSTFEFSYLATATALGRMYCRFATFPNAILREPNLLT